MSSIVYLKNKANGKTYAYLNESVWNSELKRCQCKRKCLGHVDPDTGDIVPNRGAKEKEAVKIQSLGAMLFLTDVAESIGLTDSLKESFEDDWKLILSVVFYILMERKSFAHIRFWSMDNDTPFKRPINAQMISDFLGNISENNLFIFFREWRDRNDSDGFYMIHTSSISSYDRRSETIRFNDLPIVSINPTTDLSMIFSTKTDSPITYELYNRKPMSFTDIRKRETEKQWLDMDKIVQILDMDFCTDENMDDLLSTNHRFLIRAPPEFHFAKQSVERVKDRIMDLNNYRFIDGEPYFIMSFLNYWKGKKVFTHIIYSTAEAEKEFSLFLGLIEECKRELKNGVFIPEHKDFYEKYFLIRELPHGRLVEENGEAIMTYNTVAGFLVFVSNTVKNPDIALRYYFRKDITERNFENLLNEKDRRSLELYDDGHYRGRLFIQFLAKIMYSEILRIVHNNALLKDMTFSEIIHEMSDYRRISIPGFGTPFYTNLNNVQTKIIKAFGIDPGGFDTPVAKKP